MCVTLYQLGLAINCPLMQMVGSLVNFNDGNVNDLCMSVKLKDSIKQIIEHCIKNIGFLCSENLNS